MSEKQKLDAGTIRLRGIFPDRPVSEGPRLGFPKADPHKPPTTSELIMEALANFAGIPSEVDLMAPPENTPRHRRLRTAAGIGSLAGVLNPAMVKKILPMLKMPARLAKTGKVWEEFKHAHPGAALFSKIEEPGPHHNLDMLAGMEPFPAAHPSVQAPDAPVLQVGVPRKPRTDAERQIAAITGLPPTDVQPGRIALIINEMLEDLDPTHTYGVLKHEANHAAQLAKDPRHLIPRYHVEQAQAGYFGAPIESRSRFAGYKGMGERLGIRNLTADQIQALRGIQDSEQYFDTFTPNFLFEMRPAIQRQSRDAVELIRALLQR